MKAAAIDLGSNTLRMLLAEIRPGRLVDCRYFRNITRLAGELHGERGLARQSIERTCLALEEFAATLAEEKVDRLRIVGTAVLRTATNAGAFVEEVRRRCGLAIEIIDGDTEAELSCRGILSVLEPLPTRALLFDIGGGSTELILFDNESIVLRHSCPLGVVRLLEDFPSPRDRRGLIRHLLGEFGNTSCWRRWQREGIPIELVGTAGTVTTLAALKLQMTDYSGERVNNLVLERNWLADLAGTLKGMSLVQRCQLAGMEEGRADLIIPGLEVVAGLFELTGADRMRVADAGLLEGVLFDLADD